MTRAFLIVMDSVGCGGAPDAIAFGDEGANTLSHIAIACARGAADTGRSGPLQMPNLEALGLGAAVKLASGDPMPGFSAKPTGGWGAATEISKGKDTPSGHWELAGVPVTWDWTYFPDEIPAFPPALVEDICYMAGVPNILGNCHASGVPIIEQLGAEHLRTGWPIVYTSADSVVQIAAHEESFGLGRLIALCQALAPKIHAAGVGRVIARPFTGQEGAFTRTANRRDFAVAPPSLTLIDWVQKAGGVTHAIGKIGDIFSGRGIDHLHKGQSDSDLFEHLMRLGREAEPGSFTFANFVEFDSLYGHRRDIAGYARALEWFDARVGEFLPLLQPDDIAIFTADHGNDPTWQGTDHTRERVPVLVAGAGSGTLGLCGFIDIAASIAAHLGVRAPLTGKSFL